MDVREKLTHILTSEPEMLKNLNVSIIKLYRLVDKLITNGVTVQEWISVKDGLPKDRDWVLVYHTGYATPKKAKYKDDFSPHLPVFLIDGDNGNKGEVTHWMPLPQPPKGK